MLKQSEITKSHKTGLSLLREWEWPENDKTPEKGFYETYTKIDDVINRRNFKYIGIALDLSNKKKIVGGCSVETIPMCAKNKHNKIHLCIPKETIINTKEADKCDSKYIEFCNIVCFFCFFVFVFAFVQHTHQHTRRRTTSHTTGGIMYFGEFEDSVLAQ